MRRCYFSKNYPGLASGGSIAKRDMEIIMDNLNFVNIGSEPTYHHGKVKKFFCTLKSVVKTLVNLKKGDLLVLQYPLKKFYPIVCTVAKWKGAKLITLIYDFGYYRRKKVTRAQEKKRLEKNDYLIVANDVMKNILIEQDYKQGIGILTMWDLRVDAKPLEREPLSNTTIEVIYAGVINYRHNFVYELDQKYCPKNYKFTVYGGGFDLDKVTNKDRFEQKGHLDSAEIINTTTGDWGLIWYGNSIEEIDGIYGEYLQVTTSHKPSLYVRSHIPIIAWSKSAYAPFVKEHNIGICIDSLEELDDILPKITKEEYLVMKNNTKDLSDKLANGYFFKQAYLEAEKYLLKNT